MAHALTAPDFVKDWSRKVPPGLVFWQYLDDSNNFVSMPEEYGWLHEEHLRSGAKAFEYDVSASDGTNTCRFAVNLTEMTCWYTESNVVRCLRRLVVCDPPHVPGVLSAAEEAARTFMEPGGVMEYVNWNA